MKNIILLGASKGLGKSLGKLLLKKKYKIIAICRTHPDYECEFIKTDLLSESNIDSTIQEIMIKYPKFDAIINCCGTINIDSLEKIKYDDIQDVFKVNTFAPLYFVSKLISLIKTNEADIINIASIMGTLFDVEKDSAIYTTSKWAIRGLSYNLSNELKETRCRVCNINAGGMKTNLFDKYPEIKNVTKTWIDPNDVSKIILQCLELPKQIELTDITFTRKF